MPSQYHYPGRELGSFEHAINWKNYFKRHMEPFIGSSVLEVGGGIGGTTQLLNKGTADNWTVLEPDIALFEQLKQKRSPGNTFLVNGDINSLANVQFDTILYIDVLEHIQDDKSQLEKAIELLKPTGYLVVLSPAFNCIYSEFDKEIGHYKRYCKKDLNAITPFNAKLLSTKYLDTLGFVSALVNKLFLRQSYPSKKQVLFWDKVLIPVSKVVDRFFFYSFGKSILAIWQKNKDANARA